MHAFFADKLRQSVECCHQNDKRRDDACNESGENLAAFLEDTDEVFTDVRQPAKLFFLLDILQLVLEFLDSDIPCRLGKHDKIVARMRDGLLAVERRIRDHRSLPPKYGARRCPHVVPTLLELTCSLLLIDRLPKQSSLCVDWLDPD